MKRDAWGDREGQDFRAGRAKQRRLGVTLMMGIGGTSGGTAEGKRLSRLAAWPMGALGMVAMIVAIEAHIAAHDFDLLSLGTYNWRYSAQAARREAPDEQILCLGSSLIKCGVVARVVGHESGRTCLNLAVGNGRITSSYYLLKRALEAGARPAAILVDSIDGPVEAKDRDALPEGLASNWRNWPEILTLHDAVELAVAARSTDFLNAVLLSRVLPSYRTRFEIRAVLKAVARREKLDDTRLWLRISKRNWDFNRGTLMTNRPEPPTLVTPEAESASEVPQVEPAPGPGSLIGNRLGETYTRRLIELARAHGITVFWSLPPMHPIARFERRRNGYDAYFTREARAVMTEFPNVVVIDGRHAGYPACRFPDKVHLGTLGSYAHSAELAAIIKRHLAAPATSPRWYELPRYRDRPIEILSEDMSTSARLEVRAIREQHARRQAAMASATRDGRGGAGATARR